jgi:hypothetical protein
MVSASAAQHPAAMPSVGKLNLIRTGELSTASCLPQAPQNQRFSRNWHIWFVPHMIHMCSASQHLRPTVLLCLQTADIRPTHFCSSTNLPHRPGVAVIAEACCCCIRQGQVTPMVLTDIAVLLAALTTQFFTAITAQLHIVPLTYTHYYCRIYLKNVLHSCNQQHRKFSQYKQIPDL